MSNLYDANLDFIKDQFPRTFNHIQNTDAPNPDDRGSYTIKLPSGTRRAVPIEERAYRARARESVNDLEAGNTVVVGVDRAGELQKIARATAPGDLLYLETDPDRFEEVLRRVDLTEEPFGDRLELFVPQSGYEVPLTLAEWVNQKERYVDLPQLVVGSRSLVTLLRGQRSIDRWFQAVFYESPANLTDEMFEEIRETLEPDEGVPEAYFYRRYRDLLEAVIVAGPGIDTVESERQPLESQPELPPLSVVILSWNRWELTEGCLTSVLEECRPPDGSQVLVVDNGSDDESPDRLREMEEEYDSLDVIYLDENRGPAGGREAATPHIEHEFAVFLDNDSRIRDRDCYRRLMMPFMTQKRAGAVGAYGVVHLDDQDPSILNQKIVLPDVDVPVNWCSGYCLAMRVEALKEAGGWRPDLYNKWGSEDVAIHYALRENGWYSIAPGTLVPVDHASAHKQDHYDYDFKETWQNNIEVFREEWGQRLRILNLAESNTTRDQYQK